MRFRDLARAGSAIVLTVAALLIASACGSKDQLDGPQARVPSRAVASSDDPSLPPGYASSAPIGTSAALAANASGDGGLATPGPTALTCATDDDCITHRCNLAYGRCAFPCITDNDCVAGTYCYRSVVSACMPKEQK